MKNTYRLIAAAILFTISMHAFAQCPVETDEEDDDEDACQSVRSYNYIGIKGGTNRINSSNVASSDSTAFGFVLGHRANDLFSAEFEYMSLAKYSTALGYLNATAIDVAVLHTWQMSDSFAMYGRLGVAWTQTITNIPGQGANIYDLTYGAGFEITANKDISIRLSYDHYNLSLGNVETAGLTAVSFLYKY